MRLRILIARVFVTLSYVSSLLVQRVYPEVHEQNRGIQPLWPFWRGDAADL